MCANSDHAMKAWKLVFCFCWLACSQDLQRSWPNCALSFYPTGSFYSYYSYSCNNIPSGIQITVSVNDGGTGDYLDVWMCDATNYNTYMASWSSSASVQTCLCPNVCFNNGKQGVSSPDPKVGTCNVYVNTVYIVIKNRNAVASVNNLLLSVTPVTPPVSPTSAPSATSCCIGTGRSFCKIMVVLFFFSTSDLHQ